MIFTLLYLIVSSMKDSLLAPAILVLFVVVDAAFIETINSLLTD